MRAGPGRKSRVLDVKRPVGAGFAVQILWENLSWALRCLRFGVITRIIVFF